MVAVLEMIPPNTPPRQHAYPLAEELVEDVAAQAHAHNQDNHQPDFVGIENVDWLGAECLVGQHGRMTNVISTNCMMALRSSSPNRVGDAMQLRLELQEHGNTGADGDTHLDGSTSQKRTQRPNISRAAISVVVPRSFSFVARLAQAGDDNYGDDSQETRRNGPASQRLRQESAEGAEDGNQREGAQTG